MTRKSFAMLAPALMLLACERNDAPPQAADPELPKAQANQAANAVEAPAPPAAAANSADDGTPDFTPPELTPEAERGVEGARNVLLSFARAIEEREFGQAWALLSAADKRRWSRAQFAALFADLGESTVAIPAGTMEGAAGSSYYTAPVTITASDKDGRPVRIEGEAVLRRVNDIDGSTPAQRRWRFEGLTLDWSH